MSFTREQIKEIKEKLAILGSKDNNLPLANELSGEEIIAIVQDGENRKIGIGDFYSEFENHINQAKIDFFNVSMYLQRYGDSAESAYLTLDEALDKCPVIIRRGGQVITFLDKNNNWELWQCMSASSEMSDVDWKNVELWKNLEDNPNLGIIFTASDTNVLFGDSKDITFHFETIDGGNATSIRFDVYNTRNTTTFEVNDEDKSHYDYTLNINSNTKVAIKVLQYGIQYEKEISINLVYPAWIGSGDNSDDIKNDDNKFLVSTEINNVFDIGFSDTKNLIITIPHFIVLNQIKMNGFDVPMKERSVELNENNIRYYTYISYNKYTIGIHRFTIGTYNGDDHDAIDGLQQEVVGLQYLVGRNTETNTEQSVNIENITSRVVNLEENMLNTTDDEDLITVDNKYKLANKTYDQVNFSGKGRIYLRKNIIEVQDQNDPNITRRINYLDGLMVSGTNNRYIIQYDYTLEDNELTFGVGSILQYAGGTISNGTLNVGGVILLPGWQNIIGENLTITGIPTAGSYYFDSNENKLKISNGENWIEIIGEVINNEIDNG